MLVISTVVVTTLALGPLPRVYVKVAELTMRLVEAGPEPVPAATDVSIEPVLSGIDGATVELEAIAASLEDTGDTSVGAAVDEATGEGIALLPRAVIGQTVV